MFCPNKEEMLCDAHFFDRPLQSGKSTAIARYLVGRPEAPGGFRTHWDRAGGRLTLELLETGETLSVATLEPHRVRADRAASAAAGDRLPSAPAGARPLRLHDAPRHLERCSPVFQRAVFTLLDGPTPVLGVLRRHAKSPFWGPVSRRADVRLLPLTVENRAEIPTELARLLG